MEGEFLHILHVNMSIDPVTGGGTAERTVQLARALVRSGHSSALLTLDLGLDEQFQEELKRDGQDVLLLPCVSKRFYVPRLPLKKIAAKTKSADVVHIMGHWTLINIVVFLFCLIYKKPYVVCPAGSLPVFGRSKIIKKIYNLFVGKSIVRNANKCIAVTKDEADHFVNYGVSPAHVTVIPNGINLYEFISVDNESFKAKHGIKGPFILFMGRLNEIKGPDLLLDAFIGLKERYPTLELVFIGPDEGMLGGLKARSLDPNIHYLGYIGGIEKSQAYHAADFLVIPSRQEAMSIVVLEAGAAGTPVLITDQCGFNEIETVDGGKVVEATVESIKSGIESMIDDENLLEMGERLNSFVNDNYQWDKMAGRYLSVYESILESE